MTKPTLAEDFRVDVVEGEIVVRDGDGAVTPLTPELGESIAKQLVESAARGLDEPPPYEPE